MTGIETMTQAANSESFYAGALGRISRLMIVLAIVFQVMMTRFQWGRAVFSVGGNETAALFSGIAVGRVGARDGGENQPPAQGPNSPTRRPAPFSTAP